MAVSNESNGIAGGKDLASDLVMGAQALSNRAEAARKAVKQAARVTSQRTSKRTSKSAQTRERILDAAGKLIIEKGGIDFQMSEVADRCDMSKGALYYYFPDRDAIVEEIFSAVIDEFATQLESAVATSRSAEEALRSLIRAYGELVQAGGLFVAAMATELLRGGTTVLPQLKKRFNRITNLVSVQIQRAQGEGLAREDVDADVAAVTICGAILFGASKKITLGPNHPSLDDVTEGLFSLIVYGIGKRVPGEGA